MGVIASRDEVTLERYLHALILKGRYFRYIKNVLDLSELVKIPWWQGSNRLPILVTSLLGGMRRNLSGFCDGDMLF